MRHGSCLKIWRLFFNDRLPPPGPWPQRRGAAMLMALALFLVFSSIGLSLVFLTQVTLKSSLSKKNTTVLDVLTENGLKQGYLSLHGRLAGRPFPLKLEGDRLASLRSDAEKKGTALIEEALGGTAQFLLQGGWEDRSWEGSVGFVMDRFQDLDSYCQAEYKVVIASQGKLAKASVARSASMEASLIVMAGSLPLASFPVLLSGPGQPEEPDPFPDLSGLTILPQPGVDHLARVLSSEGRLLPQDARPALEEALRIKLFSPQDLSPWRLRQALGLEVSDEPVPDGVYLVRSDLGLGGVYVQGDLEELITAVVEDAQVICFRNKDAEWILKFHPVRGWTEFSGPGSSATYEDLVEPVIIVDGAVKSLGGGRPDETGRLHLCPDEEIASILQGVRLTLVSSGRIVLSSHLLQEGVVWQQGLPYVKESESQLFIFSTGTDFTSGAVTEGGITVGPGAPADLKVQAELVASGEGFHIEGESKNVHLLGSLQAADIDLGSNRLTVSHDPGLLDDNDLARRLLGTASPVLLVSSFKLLVWKDYDR
jgi:hypothetical protein